MKSDSNIDASLLDKKDDWLSQEKLREARISAWDFDDNASFLKQEHNDHCEAKIVKENHYQAHQKFNQLDFQQAKIKVSAFKKVFRTFSILFSILIVFFIVLSFLNSFFDIYIYDGFELVIFFMILSIPIITIFFIIKLLITFSKQ